MILIVFCSLITVRCKEMCFLNFWSLKIDHDLLLYPTPQQPFCYKPGKVSYHINPPTVQRNTKTFKLPLLLVLIVVNVW